MTFDDGILIVYTRENVSQKGDIPKYELKEKSQYYFGYETVGFKRYFTALANNQQIDTEVHIDLDRDIKTKDIVRIDGEEGDYQIVQVQHAKDEDGLWFSRLSLSYIQEQDND